eukprot:562516-Pyramimonas_sp.AAC.1
MLQDPPTPLASAWSRRNCGTCGGGREDTGGANRVRGGGICLLREPITRGEAAYAYYVSQSREGRRHIPEWTCRNPSPRTPPARPSCASDR